MTRQRHLPWLCLLVGAITVGPACAATVDAQLCISATVLNQSPFDVISGGGPVCASVSGSAAATTPGETVLFDDYFEDLGILGGGGNTTGTTVDYSIRFDWSYTINTVVSGPNETASARVGADIFGLEFTSGNGSGSQVISDSLEDGLFVDYFVTVYAEGHASSTAPVPLPAAGWLFVSGGLALLGLRRRPV